VGEGENFPAFQGSSGSGGSTAGRQRRSSTCPQAFLVDLPWCAITQALVLTLRVVKIEPGANTSPGFGHSRISVEVDLLVFETAPSRSTKMLSMQRPFATLEGVGRTYQQTFSEVDTYAKMAFARLTARGRQQRGTKESAHSEWEAYTEIPSFGRGLGGSRAAKGHSDCTLRLR
jgi:hypothetical protein